jgi:hypothetical protein
MSLWPSHRLTSAIGTRPASCTEGHESFGGVLGAGAAYRLDNGVQRRWSSGAAVAPPRLCPPRPRRLRASQQPSPRPAPTPITIGHVGRLTDLADTERHRRGSRASSRKDHVVGVWRCEVNRDNGGALPQLAGHGIHRYRHMADRQDHKAGDWQGFRRSGYVSPGQGNRSVKPSAQPTQVRTLHLPPRKAPGQARCVLLRRAVLRHMRRAGSRDGAVWRFPWSAPCRSGTRFRDLARCG